MIYYKLIDNKVRRDRNDNEEETSMVGIYVLLFRLRWHEFKVTTCGRPHEPDYVGHSLRYRKFGSNLDLSSEISSVLSYFKFFL